MRFSKFFSSSLFALTVAVVAAGCNDKPDRPVTTLGESHAPAPTPATAPVAATTVTPAPASAPIPAAPAPIAPVASGSDAGPVEAAAPVVPETFAERVKLGKALAKEGKLDDAIAMFNRALELEDSVVPHVELARILILENDVRQAEKQADFALKAAPSSSAAWNTKGRVAMLDQDLDGARDAFVKAVDLNDDNAWAWNNKGLVEMQLNLWSDAVTSLEKATSGDYAEAYMWTNLGRAYEHEKRLLDAQAAYKKASVRGSALAKEALDRIGSDKSAQAPQPTPQ